MCKVSVIVPCYNCKPYIRQCLDSLLAQSLKDIEIIVVDNVSTDGTRDILKEYEDKMTVIYNTENIRQAGSMNKALGIAKGEYIAECDADDYVAKGMYARLYNEAHGADVVRCGFWDLYGDKKIARRVCGETLRINPLKDLYGKSLFIFLNNQPHIQSAIYKRSFVMNNKLFYRQHGIYEDTCLSFKIRTMAQRYVEIPDPLYYYRRDNPQSGSATEMNQDGAIEQYEEITRFANEHGFRLDKEIGVMKFYTYWWVVLRSKDESFWSKVRKEMLAGEIDEDYFITPEDRAEYHRVMDI